MAPSVSRRISLSLATAGVAAAALVTASLNLPANAAGGMDQIPAPAASASASAPKTKPVAAPSIAAPAPAACAAAPAAVAPAAEPPAATPTTAPVTVTTVSVTPDDAGQQVFTPDGKVTVWVPNTWERQASSNGDIVFKDPATGGLLTLGSSNHYVMASPTTPVSTGVSVDNLFTIPGHATVVNGAVFPMGWGGPGLITSFVGEKASLSNRGFALGDGSVETVSFSIPWTPQTATPSAAEITEQLTVFRSSQTGVDVDKIMRSVALYQASSRH